MKSIIYLPDGREISSGAGQDAAIMSLTVTECVNNGQELTLGSACAKMAEIRLLVSSGISPLEQGQEIHIYKEDGDAPQKIGVFVVQKPQWSSANLLTVTAYDRVCLLDRDLAPWLTDLQGWPYSLYELAGMVCNACGVELENTSIPNGTFLVQKFLAEQITGRQILQWVGEIAGRFCTATEEGKIAFGWYAPAAVAIAPTGDGQNTLGYYQNTLRFEDYTVAPIEKVQIRQSTEDVGVVYPDIAGEKNTYILSENVLLSGASSEALSAVAQALYLQLKEVRYTPCSVTVPAGFNLHAGQSVQITDHKGKSFTTYIMEKKQVGGKDVLKCTGSPRRDSSAAVNNQSYRALTGKMLNLRADLDGLQVEYKNVENQVATILEKPIVAEAESETATVQFQAVGQTGILPTVWINAVQEGEGEPSTTNIRPIRGVDALEITLCGAITDSTQEGYSGTTYTVALPETSYGGYVDWKQGKYVQTHAVLFLFNTGSSSTYMSYMYASGFTKGKPSDVMSGICSHYQYYCYHQNKVGVTLDGASVVYCPDKKNLATQESLAEWLAYLQEQYDAGTPVTVVYKLETPVEYRLEELPKLVALPGTNALSHNGNGAIAVSYNHDLALTQDIEEANAAANRAQATANANAETISALQMNTDGISASVERVQTNLDAAVNSLNREVVSLKSRVDAVITPQDVSIQIKKEIAENGTTKVTTTTGKLDETGLTIEKSGSQMKTQITETGMEVFRGSTSVLAAKNSGVDAQNLHATTYLIVGSGTGRVRFEDYGTERTACFFIGG